jgi:hypothetical protein
VWHILCKDKEKSSHIATRRKIQGICDRIALDLSLRQRSM